MRYKCSNCGKRFKHKSKIRGRYSLPKLPECPRCGMYAEDSDKVERRRPFRWLWRKATWAPRKALSAALSTMRLAWRCVPKRRWFRRKACPQDLQVELHLDTSKFMKRLGQIQEAMRFEQEYLGPQKAGHLCGYPVESTEGTAEKDIPINPNPTRVTTVPFAIETRPSPQVRKCHACGDFVDMVTHECPVRKKPLKPGDRVRVNCKGCEHNQCWFGCRTQCNGKAFHVKNQSGVTAQIYLEGVDTPCPPTQLTRIEEKEEQWKPAPEEWVWCEVLAGAYMAAEGTCGGCRPLRLSEVTSEEMAKQFYGRRVRHSEGRIGVIQKIRKNDSLDKWFWTIKWEALLFGEQMLPDEGWNEPNITLED